MVGLVATLAPTTPAPPPAEEGSCLLEQKSETEIERRRQVTSDERAELIRQPSPERRGLIIIRRAGIPIKVIGINIRRGQDATAVL